MKNESVEKNVLEYIKERGINPAVMCRSTGISRNVFQAVKFRGRKFRADELAKVCIFFKEDPKKFMGMEE